MTPKIGGQVVVSYAPPAAATTGGGGGGGGGGEAAGGEGPGATDNVTVNQDGLSYQRQVQQEINQRILGFTPSVGAEVEAAGDGREAHFGVGGQLQAPDDAWGVRQVSARIDLASWDRESGRGLRFFTGEVETQLGMPPFRARIGDWGECLIEPALTVTFELAPNWPAIGRQLLAQLGRAGLVAAEGSLAAEAGVATSLAGPAFAAALGIGAGVAIAYIAYRELSAADEMERVTHVLPDHLYYFCLSYTAQFFGRGGFSGSHGEAGREAGQAALRRIATDNRMTVDEVIARARTEGARAIYTSIYEQAGPRYRDEAADRMGSRVRYAPLIQGCLPKARWGGETFNRRGGARGLPEHGVVATGGGGGGGGDAAGGDEPRGGAGRSTQRAAAGPAGADPSPGAVQAVADRGVAGGGEPLPHLAAIQASFGRHDVTGVRAHTGDQAAAAAHAIGARAYATGDDVAFAGAPDLHTAAHEAAHVVQQRAGVHLAGGVGQAGDVYERHADAVADAVVRGQSAEALLDQHAGAGSGGVQRAVQREDRDGDGVDDGLVDLSASPETEGTPPLPGPPPEPEPLAELLAAIRATNATELPATARALSRPALRGARPDRVYQFPLAHTARRARGADLQAIADEVQRLSRRASGRIEEVERRQDWSRYEIREPLAEVEDGEVEAVRLNARLGFTPAIIQALWRRVVPGETHRRTVFTRTFTDALRDRGYSTTGVLDEPTVRQVDVAQALTLARGAAQHYTQGEPWSTYSDEEFEHVRDAVVAALGVPPDSLRRAAPAAEAEAEAEAPRAGGRRDGRGRGRRRGRARGPATTATTEFLHAVVNWQAWNRRTDATVRWGCLTATDIERFAAPIGPLRSTAGSAGGDATPTAEDAAPAEGAAPAAEGAPRAGEGADPAADGAAGSAPAADPTVTSQQRALMVGFRDQIEDLQEEMGSEARAAAAARRPARRRRGAPEAPAEPYVPPSPSASERLVTHLETVVLPRMASSGISTWSPAQVVRRGSEAVTPWANRVRSALSRALNDSDPDVADRAATAELEREGVLTGAAPLRREGWDRRLHRRRTTEDGSEVDVAPEERAPEVRRQLGDYRALLTRLRGPLDTAIRARDVDGMRSALRAIADAYPQVTHPPELVRHRWRATWPPAPATDGNDGEITSSAGRWRSALGQALGTADREHGLTGGYAERIVNYNPDAVYVDLNRTGVEVTNNHGNLLPASDMHLDPVFALRMTNFLNWLAGQGVTRMWTSGFLRSAMSPQDTHPMGMACDITGFTFSDGTIIHLRSGLPNRGGGGARDEAPPRGHSDWFDHEDRMGERTHAQIMMGIAYRMTAYFDRIVGPGHNPEHMNHFHVELSPGGGRRDGLRLMAQSSESTHLSGTARSAADARDSHWDDHIEPLPLLDEPGSMVASDAAPGTAGDDDGGGDD